MYRDLDLCIAHEQTEHARVPLTDAWTNTDEDEIVMYAECSNKALPEFQHSTDEGINYCNDNVSFAITVVEVR